MLPRLLIAAGNYDITQAVRKALRNEGVVIKDAYTHRDTLFMLQQHRFNAIIIDGQMFDRHTKEFTILALARLKNPLPRIAITLDEASEQRAQSVGATAIDDLDRETLRQAVANILGDKMPMRKKHTVNLQDERRIEEMYTLFNVSKSLTEVLELNEVLNRVVEAAKRLTNADEGMLLLPDENDPDQLILRARVGIDLETARNFRIKVEDTFAGEVYKSGQAAQAGKQGPLKVKTEYLVQSLLYVPIMLKNKPIGVLGVNNRSKEDIFDIHQQELLVNLASYAAVAIENARIHEESVDRTRELARLVKASQIISASLAINETLVNICEQMLVVLNVSRVEVYSWNQRLNRLNKRAHAMRSIWRPLLGRVLDLGSTSNLRTSLQQGSQTWTKDLESEILVIPVYSGGRLLGAVRARYVTKPEDPPEDIVLQRVRNSALEALAGLLNTAEISNEKIIRLMETINRSLRSDWCELLLASEDGKSLHMLSEVGTGVWLMLPQPFTELDKRPDLSAVMNDHAVLENPNNTNGLCLPLVHRSDAWGLVMLYENDPQRIFHQREVDTAKALASQAATALENSRLVTDLENSLTELKETQDRLVQTARLSAMGELAAVVAHQINNPLTTIIVDAELLMLDTDRSSKQFNQLQAIHRAGRRASGVARRLLSIARPNDISSPELIDVVDTVRGILQLVGTHIERRSITIHTRLPDDDENLPAVMAVKGQLDDIWLNLLMNAHDALTEEESAQIGVEVFLREEDRHIIVKIWDNGPGIPEEIRRQIFNPFFTTKPPGEGTGLGLHICRQVIESVGGSIEVESFTGKGTRFTVALPTVQQTEEAQAKLILKDN